VLRLLVDHAPQLLELQVRAPREMPFLGQGARELTHLRRVERLAEQQQAIAHPELLQDVLPRVVRISRADDALQVWRELPDTLDGLNAVPARRHAHVDECDRKRRLLGEGLLDHTGTLAALVGEADLEFHRRQAALRQGGRCLVGEEVGLELVEDVGGRRLAIERSWRSPRESRDCRR
jgi:hypothetical protein